MFGLVVCRPETAGRTLVEINDLYARGISPRKWRNEPVEDPMEMVPSHPGKVEAGATTRHID